MADWALVILTSVYVIATIVICYFNYKSSKASKEQIAEMRRQFDLENRPYVTVELIYERKLFYGLRLANHGKRIANNVRIQLNQDFIDSLTELGFQSLLEKQKGRVCIIGIGQKYDLFFGSNKFRDNPSKAPIQGHLTYSEGERTFSEEISIDFESYATIFSVTSEEDEQRKEMRAHIKELERIRIALTSISRATSSTADIGHLAQTTFHEGKLHDLAEIEGNADYEKDDSVDE